MRQIVRVVQVDAHVITDLNPDGGTRDPSRGTHAGTLRGEDPERLELARVDFLLDLVDLEVDVDLVWISVAIEVAPEGDGALRRTRDRRLLPRRSRTWRPRARRQP
jgi:hypothetical protein